MNLLDKLQRLPTGKELKGGFGEWLAKHYSNITTEALVLHDVLIDGKDGHTSQIDMVLVGVRGVYVVEHIINIYSDNKLDENSTCRNFRQVRKEGGREAVKTISFYNFNMIISLGYRVKSKIAANFRKWATERIKKVLPFY